MLDGTASTGMTLHNRNIVDSVHNANIDMPMNAIKKFDLHFNEENYYYPFRITHWKDTDKCKMSSFLVLFCDKSWYQAADRSCTFVGNPTCNSLVYDDFEEYQNRYVQRQSQIGLDDRHQNLWHEQFDSISKDFIASLDEETVSKLQLKLMNRFQKWWSLFGKYWLVKNAYNNDDTKLMNG